VSQDAWPQIIDAPLTFIFMMGQRGYCNWFCLYRQPKMTFWLTTTYRSCDFPGRMTTNRWRSVDAHFYHGAGSVLRSSLPIKGSNNSILTNYNLSEVWFPRMHDHKLLTLRWRSVLQWGREGIAICVAYKGSQNSLDDWLQPIRGVISQDAWSKIVDALLTLILPWLYPQYATIYFGTLHHSHCVGGLSGVFIYFLLDHYVVL
jgi:hypothetical protein